MSSKNLTVLLTQSGKSHLEKITKNNEALVLGLKKSGCSGYSYNLSTSKDDIIDPSLLKFNVQNVNFYIKEEHISAFDNCIIDYKKEGLNYKLVFDNPNAYNHCGCGESFNLNKG